MWGKSIQLADAAQRRCVIGQSAHGHIARSVFKGLLPGGVLHVAHFRVARSAIHEPPIVFAGRAHGCAPPLVSNGIGQETVIGFLADIARGQTSTWTMTYNVPLPDGVYRLDVIPQPVANTSTLRVTVTADPGHQLENALGAGVKA